METERKIKLWCFTSLDGFVSHIDGDIDFIAEYGGFSKCDYGFYTFWDSIGSVLMNRTQYINLQSCELWPVAGKPCYIATNEIFSTPYANIQFMLTDGFDFDGIVEDVHQMQQKNGCDVWLAGDHQLMGEYLRRGLIDEITLTVLPITLGSGLPLFPICGRQISLNLEESIVLESGAIRNRYRVQR